MLAIGTRLMDFTTGSWTVFNHDARIISHQRRPLGRDQAPRPGGGRRRPRDRGRTRRGPRRLEGARPTGPRTRRKLMAEWNALARRLPEADQRPRSDLRAGDRAPCTPPAGRARPAHHRRRRPAGRAGEGLAGQGAEYLRLRVRLLLHGLRDRAGWGYAMARPDTTPIVMIGDGTYMMMNSDVYSSVLSGHKFILIVCDNGGYAVINRLQNAKGDAGLQQPDPRLQGRSSRSRSTSSSTPNRWGRSPAAARASPISVRRWSGRRSTDRTTVITIDSDAFAWIPGDAGGMSACRRSRAAKASAKPRRPSRSQNACRRSSGVTGEMSRRSMKAKLGIAPIAWWNDDLEELSDDVSLEECLRQASEAGFTGMETGRRFPMDAAVLGPILAQLRHQRLRRLVLRPAARRRHRGGEGSHRRADGLLQGRRRALHRLWRDRPLDPGRPLEAAGDEAEALRGRDQGLRPQDDRRSANGAPSRACRSPTTTTWPR